MPATAHAVQAHPLPVAQLPPSRVLLLRQAELHGNRLHLRDNDNARCVGGMNDVALVNLTQSGTPRERRNDLGVTECRLRVVDGSLVRFHQRFKLRDRCALGVSLLR